ncbi:CheR family methyltransferase [Desulfonatronum thioautotrophicum]|uniref:CheR family methyltransferase n=1 Tax=Desulfonatronum thioautotrophicum TaxID=617001 RepID=UPI0006998964|nr:protein-glutamate O-methyltransferase CheR [Desulfonatronum thioautotrophicum]
MSPRRNPGAETPARDRFPCTHLRDEDFLFIRDLVQARFGIHLTDQKRTLVAGRLQGLLRELALPDFQAYRRYLEQDVDGQALDALANRISTNHTFFFREPEHFTYLRETILPELKTKGERSGNRDLRIWCAAASSGEEPYSIIMTMLDFFGAEYARWDAGLLATDISARALETARTGAYPEERLKGVSPTQLRGYFQRGPGGEWTVREHVRREITFRRFNLMNECLPFRRPFELIFCRNVMIYFDQPTRDALVTRLVRFLVPGGHLLIGHSESISRSRSDLAYVKPAVYRRIGP